MPGRKFINLEELISLVIMETKALGKNAMLIFNACCIMVLVFLIGFIYQKGVLNQIPLVIVDLDRTSISRNISAQFAENPKFVVTQAGGYPAVFLAIKAGQVQAALILPAGLAEDLKKGQGSDLLLVIDNTNYIIANTVYAKANEILATVNGGLAIQSLAGHGILPDQAAKLVQSVRLEQKILYNPSYNYAYYLSYGIFSAGIFSLLMSGIAVTLVRQRRQGAFRLADLAAKFIVYGIFAALVTNLVFFVARLVFALPGEGAYVNFFLLTLPFGFLIALFGMIFYEIARDELQIFQASVFFATPLLFITGYTWPLQSIPDFLHPIYYLNPLTPFMNGVRAALVMGGDFPVAFKYTSWELGLIVFYLLIVRLFFRRLSTTK